MYGEAEHQRSEQEILALSIQEINEMAEAAP